MTASSDGPPSNSVGGGDSRQVHFGHYAVCFFDLLSQRAHLERLRRLPATPAEHAEFALAAKRTVGTVTEFRKLLLEYVESFGCLDGNIRAPAWASEEQVRAFADHRRALLKTQCFADTCLLYFPMPSEISHGLKSLFGMVLGVGFTQMFLLASKVAARGSVEVDIGTDAIEGEVYGPVLARAYQLESEVAEYPRVVVGPGFAEFLEHLKSVRGERVEDQFCRAMAVSLADLVTRDSDGHLVVHFLGPAFRSVAAHLPVPMASYAAMAHRFVETSRRSFEASGNAKLLGRYERLEAYFRDNISRW